MNKIHIKKANKGLLTKKVGKKGLTDKSLSKGIAKAKKSGNVKLEREEVFAKNAKNWGRGKNQSAKSRTGKRTMRVGN
jgi:hypothetical protein